MSFWNMLLELNQADRQKLSTKISWVDTAFEDAKGGETPTLQLDHKAPRSQRTNLDAERSKLYKMTVEELAWLSKLRPDIAFAVSPTQLKLCKTHRTR